MFIPNDNRERWEIRYDIQDKTINSWETFNHLIKLVLNFKLRFSMKFGIIYIYVYIYTTNICMHIYILIGGKMSIFFQLKIVQDGE
jgi:hypothetical protein